MKETPFSELPPGEGFVFPGEFEITAVGRAGAGLEERVPALLAGADGVAVIAGSRRLRPSREGHYVAVSVGFSALSRDAYDGAHRVLRADPDVRYTL